MTEQINVLDKYAYRLLEEEQLTLLAQHNVPLFGVNGLRRWLASKSIEAFIFLYFGEEFTVDLAPIHYKMMDDIQAIKERRVANMPGLKIARAIPRGYAKSTFYSKLLPIWMFLYGYSPVTVLIANNDVAAKRLLANIKDSIDNNAAIKEDFPDIRGATWGNERIESINGNVITGYGIASGSLRGTSSASGRPSLVVMDDTDDDNSVRSVLQLATNVETFDKAIMALGDNVSYTTSYIAVGTIIRKTSLMKYILDSADFDSVVEQRIKRWSTNVELWSQWEQRYLELAREGQQPKDASEDVFYQENKSALLQDTEVLWNKRDEYYYAMVYRLARGTAAFNSEMQNTPEATNGTFGSVRYVDIATINEDDYDLLAVLDPTVTGNKTSDYAAYVEVLFNTKRKEAIVIYADVAQRSYTETIDAITLRMKQRKKVYQSFWIETNSAGAVITKLISDRLRNEGIRRLPSGIHNSIPKTERIAALSEYIARGQLYFVNNLGDEAMREIETWPLSRHDDFLDAVAMVVMKLAELRLLELVEIKDNIYGVK